MGGFNDMLAPTFVREYCNYFYFIMVIYVILGAVALGDLGYCMMTAGKGLKQFFKRDFVGKIVHIVAIAVHFFVLKLLYSMCYNSLPEKYEGFTEGNEEEDESDEEEGQI